MQKLKKIDMYRPNPINTDKITLPMEVEVLTEMLAENVHELWAENKINEENKNGVEDSHHNIVVYSELSEEAKDYDRRSAMETLKVIRKLGFEIKKPAEKEVVKSKCQCNQILKKIALVLLFILQIVIFSCWINTKFVCFFDPAISKHIVYLLLSSFMIFSILSLSRSISKEEEKKADFEKFKENELFLRSIKNSDELTRASNENQNLLNKLKNLEGKVETPNKDVK